MSEPTVHSQLWNIVKPLSDFLDNGGVYSAHERQVVMQLEQLIAHLTAQAEERGRREAYVRVWSGDIGVYSTTKQAVEALMRSEGIVDNDERYKIRAALNPTDTQSRGKA